MDSDKRTPRLPPRLQQGDTLGIVAPASHFKKEAFDNGLRILESMGFRLHIPEGLFERDDYLAGSDAHRADLMNRLFADPEIKGIICARGGYGSLRVLKYLDLDRIRRHPKAFIGFSDITAILSVLVDRCHMVVFHGPTVVGLGKACHQTQQALLKALQIQDRLIIASPGAVVIREGAATAPVVGGNLTTLCHLLGTPFAPRFSGHILLLEERGEAAYRIDRMLNQMKLAGCFEGLTGVILGKFRECGPQENIQKLVQDIIDEIDIPILAGFDIGHGEPNTTIPFGLEATLDTDRAQILFN